MRFKFTNRLVMLFLATILMSGAAFAQNKTKPKPKPLTDAELKKLDKGKMRPPSGASFYIGPVEGVEGRFSMLLTDSGQAFVEESYLLKQLAVIEAVITAAQKFAANGEATGTKEKPTVTRFYDKQEPTFVVDVEKTQEQSRFFVTMKSTSGKKLTVDAGAVKRFETNADALFFKILQQIKDATS